MINRIAKTSLAAVALLGIFAVSQGVMAAELVKLEGKVSVNRGDGFGPATLGMVLKPGDQVLVGEKSTASLVYAEPGCVFEIAPASVVTVSDIGPCIPGETIVQGKSALVTPTQSNDDDDDRLLPFFIMGGGAIIASTAIIINETRKDGSGDGPRLPAPGISGP